MDWPVILSAQPAKYLITEIEKFTSTLRAHLNVLPKHIRMNNLFADKVIYSQIKGGGGIHHYPKPQERPIQESRAP